MTMPATIEERMTSLHERLKALRRQQLSHLRADEAREFGFDLDPGWEVDIDWDELDQPKYTYVNPQKWEYSDLVYGAEDELVEYSALSPEGIRYTKAEVEALQAPEIAIEPARQALAGGPEIAPITEAYGYIYDYGTGDFVPATEAKFREREQMYEEHTALGIAPPTMLAEYPQILEQWNERQAFITQAHEDLAGYLEDLRGKGRTSETEASLKMVLEGSVHSDTGLPFTPDEIEVVVDEVFAGVYGISPEARDLMEALPSIVTRETLDWAIGYYNKNPDKLRQELITAGRNEATERLVTQLYSSITEQGLADYFSIDITPTIPAPPPFEAEWMNVKTGEYITQTELHRRYPKGYEAELDLWKRSPEQVRETAKALPTILRVFGESLTKVPKQTGAAILQAVQGQGGASVVDKDWADRLIKEAETDIEAFVAEVKAKYTERAGLIKYEDIARLPQNIAYSLTSMGGGVGAGLGTAGALALLPIPGARVAAAIRFVAWGIGTLTSGAVAYSMTTYQIMQQYLEAKNDEAIAATGKGITADEEKKLKADFDSKAREYGLWEAIPEAISNLAFAKLLTMPLTRMGLGGNIVKRIITKITGMYGEELLTETITQKGQSAIEVSAGLREGRISWVEAFKEIAPQTFLLTTIMGGAGSVGIASVNKIKASLKAEIGESHPLYKDIYGELNADIFSQIESEMSASLKAQMGARAELQPTITPEEQLQVFAIKRDPIGTGKKLGYDIRKLSPKESIDKGLYAEGYRYQVGTFPNMFMAKNEKEIADYILGKARKTPTAPVPKEAWQMTWQEFGNYERRQDTGGVTSIAVTDKFIKKQHWAIVFNAVKEGKPVPAEVLKDYPDLKPAPTPTTGLPAVAPAKAGAVVEPTAKVTPAPEVTRIPAKLQPLAQEAVKYDTFEEFSHAFTIEIRHGRYYHITDNPNFTIDPRLGPRDMSSMAGEAIPDKGKLMITSDLNYWLEEYEGTRQYVAIIDMSQVAKEKYWQVNRGFGNEFWVDDPSMAKVIKVVSLEQAKVDARLYHQALPSSKKEMEGFYNQVKGIAIPKAEEGMPGIEDFPIIKGKEGYSTKYGNERYTGTTREEVKSWLAKKLSEEKPLAIPKAEGMPEAVTKPERLEVSQLQSFADAITAEYGVPSIPIKTTDKKLQGMAVYNTWKKKGGKQWQPKNIQIGDWDIVSVHPGEMAMRLGHELAHHIQNMKSGSLTHSSEHGNLEDKIGLELSRKIKKATVKPTEIAKEVKIPTTEIGQPEAGLQPSMIEEVPFKEVRPAGKGKITQISMEDQLKLQQARRAVEEVAPFEKEVYEAQADIETLKVTHELDPVAQWTTEVKATRKTKQPDGTYKLTSFTRRVGLDSFISIKEGDFPSYFTIKQAQAIKPLMNISPYSQKGTPLYNHIPRADVLDELGDKWNMTPDEIADRVMAIRREKAKIKEAQALIRTQMTEKPLETKAELTSAEVTENWATIGQPKLTLKQVDALVGFFADYIDNPNTITAWELTRELRRGTLAGRAESLKVRAQELIVSKGINTEEGMKQAITEALAGELPTAHTDYLEGLTNELRDALFSKVYHVLKDEPFEMASTVTALTNALTGKPIPREPGVKGGSAYTRLQRVFGDQPKVLKAIDKMAEEDKSLKDVVEGIYRETGLAPIPIDELMADYLRKLQNIPFGFKTLLEEPWAPPPPLPPDTRTPAQKAIDLQKFKLELTPDIWKDWSPERLELLSYLRINLLNEEYQAKLIEEKWMSPPPISDTRTAAQRALDLVLFKIEMAQPPIPVTPFEAPIEDAFKQKPLPNMTFMEKKMIVRVLKELGMLPVDIGNLIRANVASVDMSFPRQQKTMIAGHPVAFYRAMVEAWQSLLSQKHAEANWEWITRDPLYQYYEEVAEKGKDFLRPLELKKGTSQWKGVEEYGYITGERLIPRLTGKIPWVKWSARAFVTGTNTHNWLIFKTLYKATLRRAEKIASGEIKLQPGEGFDIVKEMTDYAGMITDFTQRASLGKAAPLAPALSAMFFAPRSKLGRLLTPRHLLSANPRVRAEAWKDLTLFVTAFGGLVMVGALLGLWEVERDPRSGEFMSIRIGNLRIDPWAGYRQFVVLYARLISGTGVSSVTGAEYEVNPIGTLTNFFRSSLGPMASIILDFWTGKNFLGETVDVANKEQWLKRIAPFSVQDIWEAWEEDWRLAAIGAIPGIFGEGVQTYTGDWKENFTKLGLPKYLENTAYGITEPKYDTADFWADTSSQFKNVDPSTLTKAKGFPEYIRAIAEARIINEYLDTLPNEKLVRLNADPMKDGVKTLTFIDYHKMWADREKLVVAGDKAEFISSELQPDGKYKDVIYKGEDAITAFDKKNPGAEKGNFSQRQFALLNEYWTITDKKKQVEFLKLHNEEIGINLRQDYLKSHPKENAQLAVWGQATILTKEAYNQFLGLVKSLDIPDSAIPPLTLPPATSIDTHFAYQDMVAEGTHGSWEADLLLKQDAIKAKEAGVQPYADWAELKLSDTPIASLEIKTKPEYRGIYDKINDLSDSDSPDYIADEKARAEAVKKLKAENPDFVDDTRRIEAIEKGTDESPIDDALITTHVGYGNLIDKEGVGSSSAEVMLYRVDNPDYNTFRMDINIWGDNALKPIDESRIPIWRIDVKYAKEDAEYNALPAEGDARANYLEANEEYRKDRRRRDAYNLSFVATGVIPSEERTRLLNILIRDRDIDQANLEQARRGKKPYEDWSIEITQTAVDNLNEIIKYSEGKPTTKTVDEMLAWLGVAKQGHLDSIAWVAKHPEATRVMGDKAFHEEWIKHYEDIINLIKHPPDYKKFPENQIENYVAYYEIPTKGKRQERFVVENTEFAAAMYRITGKDIWLTKLEDVPNVTYDDIYDKYEDLFNQYKAANATDKERIFAENPAFKEAYYRRKAYGELWDEKYVENYATYMLMPEKGYAKERFLKSHMEFYRYAKKKLGWTEDIDFDKIPSEAVEKLYDEYVDMQKRKIGQAALDAFRDAHRDLDAWGVLRFGWTPIADKKRRAGMTPKEKFEETAAAADIAFDIRMEKLRKRLEELGK